MLPASISTTQTVTVSQHRFPVKHSILQIYITQHFRSAVLCANSIPRVGQSISPGLPYGPPDQERLERRGASRSPRPSSGRCGLSPILPSTRSVSSRTYSDSPTRSRRPSQDDIRVACPSGPFSIYAHDSLMTTPVAPGNVRRMGGGLHPLTHFPATQTWHPFRDLEPVLLVLIPQHQRARVYVESADVLIGRRERMAAGPHTRT